MTNTLRLLVRMLAGLACLVAVLLFLLDLQSRADNARVEAIRSSIESQLRTSLVQGDKSEKIERVLKEKNLRYIYSDILKGYYCTVPTKVSDTRISVAIAVDDNRTMKTIKVEAIYTSL